MRHANVIVLALILIIGAGIIFSFAGTTRDAANRTRCTNNLRMLALALESYHAGMMRYPMGTVPHLTLPPEERFSWNIAIWPHMIGGVVLELDFEKGWKAEENRPVKVDYPKIGEKDVLDSVTWLTCPGNRDHNVQDSLGITHYVGLAGIGNDAAMLPGLEDPEGRHRLGAFGYDRRTRRNDVEDGLSLTISIVETALDNGPWTAGGPPTVRGVNQAITPYLGVGRQFGVIHKDATMTAFLDGSVRYLSNNAPPQVLDALATIAGREKISSFDNEH